MFFTDFRKSFDKVNRSKQLWSIMENNVYPRKPIRELEQCDACIQTRG